jgi:hypothetical protein
MFSKEPENIEQFDINIESNHGSDTDFEALTASIDWDIDLTESDCD